MSDSDLFNLYSHQILGLAASIPHTEPLVSPDRQAQRRSPLCGSTVSVGLTLRQGRIEGYGQRVQACALGQASAAIFGAAVIGCSRGQIATLCAQLAAMLQGGPAPGAPFQDYAILAPAQAYPNRHASILLAPQATLQALDET
ncbi:MAG TPA: iron-sulfur cluster assembly scaffold protein [Paenirhodobacter sp.]